MPADPGEYQTAFRDLIGTASRDEAWYGESVAGWHDWVELFEQTGIDFDSHAETIDAFENFLLAYYPQEGLSRDDWEYTRLEFAYMYGLRDMDDAFWEAWREAIGY